jgi:hypothetical protein
LNRQALIALLEGQKFGHDAIDMTKFVSHLSYRNLAVGACPGCTFWISASRASARPERNFCPRGRASRCSSCCAVHGLTAGGVAMSLRRIAEMWLRPDKTPTFLSPSRLGLSCRTRIRRNLAGSCWQGHCSLGYGSGHKKTGFVGAGCAVSIVRPVHDRHARQRRGLHSRPPG